MELRILGSALFQNLGVHFEMGLIGTPNAHMHHETNTMFSEKRFAKAIQSTIRPNVIAGVVLRIQLGDMVVEFLQRPWPTVGLKPHDASNRHGGPKTCTR